MKASVRWLREICPELPEDAEVLAARFTAAGIEVEATQAFGAATEHCLVAEVLARRPHPSRSGLQIVTVDAGARAGKLEVVCGASNVPEAGGLVVLAPVGTYLPAKGVTLERRPIAGVESAGMLCSEKELGLGDDDAGILVLPSKPAPPGTSLAQAVPEARDTILEIGLTPNRADGLGHVGLAREAAALFGSRFVDAAPSAGVGRGRLGDQVSIAIEDGERCPYYGAVVLSGATVAPSPLGVRWRLGALGVRSISNVVDVTNLVMLEYGHPLHAFDLDKVRGGRIVVRRATEGERLLTLDGVDRALSADDLVICDGEGPVALAGVMGGGNSEISASTARILVECAYFEPRGVRRAARRHALHTESSHRFERGVDWGDTPAVLGRTEELIAILAGASPSTERRVIEAHPLARRMVALRTARIGGLLGADVDREDARAILGRLGFVRQPQPEGADAAADVWEVPSHRSDVAREVDLIEEVARVRGYDAIPAVLPAVHPSRDRAPQDGRARRAREAATGAGLSEAISLSFVSPGDLEAVGAPAAAVTVSNPLREDQSVMRTSLLPGLLHAVARARRHGEREARLFSVGRVFLAAAEGGTEERLMLSAVLAGSRAAWLSKPQPLDVWDGKGLVEGLVRRLVRRDVVVQPPAAAERPRHLHPRGAAWIEVDGARVGSFGPLHPDAVDAFSLGESVLALELDIEALEALGRRAPAFVAPPRFPASLRDVAVVVRDDVAAGDLEGAVREAAGELAEQVTLFDRFSGGAIPAGHASLALRVVYRAPDRTLTDAEVDARHERVVAQIRSRFGGELRS
jgi:phenylalanyl-tRNA synthetase beta chain